MELIQLAEDKVEQNLFSTILLKFRLNELS